MIIVTRPSSEGVELTTLLNQAAIPAQHVPLFDIQVGQDLPKLQFELNQLTKGDYVIVVSPQVSHTLKSHSITLPSAKQIHYFAIGKQSAALFSQLFHCHVDFPEQENSEGLLQLFESKKVTNQTILILRGNSGRTVLADTLVSRKAKVKLIECYKREPILYPHSPFSLDIHQQIIVITSVEILEQLEFYPLRENKNWATLVVTSPRIANQARVLGWQNIKCCDGANNKILFKTIETLCHNGI